jgi:hypothetical protein
MTHELRAFFLEVDALVDTGVDVISIDETGFFLFGVGCTAVASIVTHVPF